jgi:hypothetical protein
MKLISGRGYVHLVAAPQRDESGTTVSFSKKEDLNYNDMQQIKKIDREFIGDFQILDYHRPHCQLLLRCSNFINDMNVNLDIKFEGVDYIELPVTLHGLYITNGQDNDWEYIKSRFNSEIYNTPPHDFHELYKIISEGKIYYILAALCWIDTNALHPNKTTIAPLDKYA